MARAKTMAERTGATGFAAMPLPAGALMDPQMKLFWQTQDRILNEAEDFARSWFARRHTAVVAALKACERAAEAQPADPAGAVQAIRDWQAHSAERVAEDLREWAEMWARCAGHVVNSEARTTDEMREEVQHEAAG